MLVLSVEDKQSEDRHLWLYLNLRDEVESFAAFKSLHASIMLYEGQWEVPPQADDRLAF